ncbi:hypothetical protein KVV02_001628 [Mortierella alpina]|uniref:F-box domain-containing protein n=1 Tax=Mortierella alpina TaxID=64518 RepID=A0A9P8A9P2_MORAP|nr:hypothetical protein KVV02_001628 [Mortierella alpina]
MSSVGQQEQQKPPQSPAALARGLNLASTAQTLMPRRSKRRHDGDSVVPSDRTPPLETLVRDATETIDPADAPECAVVTSSHNSTPAYAASFPAAQNRLFYVPEIVRLIAEFLDKPTLAASCRVSRTWAALCTPLLWKHIGDKDWRDGRFCAAIKSQSHYIQSMRCEDWTDYEEILLCPFPRLKAIAFQGNKEPIATKDKIMEKLCRSLTSLALNTVASRLTEETIHAIQRMEKLTTLKLVKMDVSYSHLLGILAHCDGLEFFSVSSVKFLSFEDNQTLPVTCIRYLALKEIDISLKDLSIFLKQCPDLLELSLARNEELAISAEFFQSLKEFCPQLYGLDVGSCKLISKETFCALFTTISQLTALNLAGTVIADGELQSLAENCKGLVRLDIQYCTAITSQGLHRFLTLSGPSLKHLEASGITIEPSTFDRRAWKCSNLQILFVHIGLVGSVPPRAPTASSVTSGSTDVAAGGTKTGASSTVATTGADCSSSSLATVEVDSPGNDRKRPQTTEGHTYFGPVGYTSACSLAPAAKSAPSPSPPSCEQDMDSDGDIGILHELHPIQEMCNVQYLGLMGYGPKLTCGSANQLIRGFRSVKRLHLLGLYQAFKKEDLEWLVDVLPELCRIDAEKYNISDDLLHWFETAYPHVHIHRHD